MKTLTRIALLSIFLTGCAQVSTQSVGPHSSPATPKAVEKQNPVTKEGEQKESGNEKTKVNRSANNTWKATGRMAVNNKDKGTNVSFVWQQYPSHYQIRLFGPFGSGSVYVTGYPQYVELKESNGKVTRASSAEELLYKSTGLSLPITGLHYWMQGIPYPDRPIQSQRNDNNGSLQHLSQQGWFIQYQNYQSVQGKRIPTKLSIQNPDVRAKMVITQWQL